MNWIFASAAAPGRPATRTNARRPWIGPALAVLGLTALASPLPAVDPTLPRLTNFSQVLALGLAGAREAAHPAGVRGVVVALPRNNRDLLYLSDGTNGLAAGLRPNHFPAPQLGQLVEVEGETAAGSSHPFLAQATLRSLGPGSFPTPLAARGRDLAQGRYHGKLVRLRAVILDLIRTRGRVELQLNADGYGFHAECSERTETLPTHWVNASVDVQGMPWLQFDSGGKPAGFKLLVTSNQWIQVLSPHTSPPAHPPSTTLQTLRSAPLSDDRLSLTGVVTYAWMNHFVTLQDPTEAALAYPLHPIARSNLESERIDRPPSPNLQPGDRVAVIASHSVARPHSPRLENCEFRVLDRVAPPEAPTVSEAELLSGQHDAHLVRVIGRVVDSDVYEQSGDPVRRLWLKIGEQTYPALGAGRNFATLPIAPGQRVALRALCLVSPGVERPVRTFTLYLPGPDDIRVVPDPPVWRSPAVLRAGGTIVALLVLTLSWAWVLRRQVQRRTAELQRSNERLAAEFRERARADADRALRMQLLSLNVELAAALNTARGLRPMLQCCAEALVAHLGAAFARIWTLNEPAQMLELQASAGRYLHLDGAHASIPVGHLKIGRIAQEQRPHLTNDVQQDPAINDKAWAQRENMVAFAGYPLVLEGRLLGVVAVFAHQPLDHVALQTLGSAAHSIALGIQRLHSQAALAESEARLRTITDHNPAGIVVLDSDQGRFIEANGTAERLTGFRRVELLQRGFLDISAPLQADRRPVAEAAATLIQRALANGHATFEWVSRKADGTEFPSETRAARIPLPGRNLIVASIVDITDRKQAEIEMAKALAHERDLHELKSNFVSMVSHEFRTPLGVIQSASDVLDRYLDRLTPEKRRHHLNMIVRSTRGLTQLVEGVLLLGRVEDGRVQFRSAALDLQAWCTQLVDEVMSATTQTSPILFQCDGPLDGAVSDPQLLRHIFANLLTNAVKYSEPGSPVEFSVERQGANARFNIRDHGIGIPEDDQANLFKSFARGRNVGSRPGTGLGLVVVQRCVQLHAGQLELQSRLNAGTTVTVTLPMFDRPTPV